MNSWETLVGNEDLLNNIVNGLFSENGSYTIIGGSNCGKSSILRQIEEQLMNKSEVQLCSIDVENKFKNQISQEDTFGEIYLQMVNGLCKEALKDHCEPCWGINGGLSYDEFIKRLQQVKTYFETRYGPNWIVVLLIDRIDYLFDKLNKDVKFFSHLKAFQSDSDFTNNFRVVATGVKSLQQILPSNSSVLRDKYLGIISETAVNGLISSFNFDDDVMQYFVELTGRHPYIINEICKRFHQNKVTKQDLESAKIQFLAERGRAFDDWLKDFSDAECTIYHLLAEKGGMTKDDLKKYIPAELRHLVKDSTISLRYHCVIDGTHENGPFKIAGTMFKEWFMENCPQNKVILIPEPKIGNT